MKKFLAFSSRDLKDMGRDPMLFIGIFVPLLITAIIRFVIPLVTEILLQRLNFNLTQHYEFITGFLIMIIPMMMGFLIGFIILDERDENMLVYFSVTPLTKTGYLALRIVNPVLLSFTFSIILLPITNLVELNYFKVIPVAVLAALEAPMMVLFLGAFAGNKVEGLALSKTTGIIFFAPIVAYLVESRWEILLGIFPTYWVLEAFIASFTSSASYWFFIFGGLIVHIIYLYLLYKMFNNKMN